MQIDECSGTFIRNNHQTWSENVLEEAGTIRKVGSTINSSYHFHAWLSHSRRESGAAAQCILSRLGAGEAARLAPSEEACGLAVLEAVLGNRVVALRATSADAQVPMHARSELVVIDAGETKRLLAASILLLANSCGIRKCSLVISAAGTSGLQAWLSHGRREAGAATQCILSRLGAGEAARLAPAEEACGLAVLEAVLGNRVVALRATSADAQVGLHASSELVVIDAGETKRPLAASILLLANSRGIRKCSLVISAAGTSGLQARLSHGRREAPC